VAKNLAGGFEILGMLLKIRGCSEMPELMRRHVNADMPREGVNNLDGKGGLTLPAAVPCYEEIAILVSAKPRQDLTAIPSKTPGNVIGNLAVNISPFGLCVVGGNVKKEPAPRTVGVR
jgi:hypothetical protein